MLIVCAKLASYEQLTFYQFEYISVLVQTDLWLETATYLVPDSKFVLAIYTF